MSERNAGQAEIIIRRHLAAVREQPCPPLPVPDYLGVAENIVRNAVPWQAADGRIIDPNEKCEVPTATARFIGALGLLLQQGRCRDLVNNCQLALTPALEDLQLNRTNWGEFIVKEALMGYAGVKPYSSPEQIASWEKKFSDYDPERNYTHCRPENGGGSGNNFVTFAIAGEAGKQFFRLADNQSLLDRLVALQLRHFDANGMYRDPNCPMTYDLVGRMNLTLARAFGYQGEYQAELDRVLRLGALQQLLYQSPTGEMPYGGRSNQQNFTEATFALICEYEAKHCWQQGERELAGLFKRAAALAFSAIYRYVSARPVFFSKNFFPQDTSPIHGRERGYGWYSPYSLLIASQFGFAAKLAQPDIPQLLTPPEGASYCLELSEDFHRFFASCQGLQIEIDRNSQAGYDATGWGRLQRHHCPPLLALSAPLAAEPHYLTTIPAGADTAIGPVINGVSLASRRGAELYSRIVSREISPAQVRFSIEYSCPQFALQEDYTLTPAAVEYQAQIKAGELLIRVPAIISDGQQESRLELTDAGLAVYFAGASYRVSSLTPGCVWQWEEQHLPNRNGIYRVCRCHCPGQSIRLRFTLQEGQTAGTYTA